MCIHTSRYLLFLVFLVAVLILTPSADLCADSPQNGKTSRLPNETEYDRARRFLHEGDFLACLDSLRRALRSDFDNAELKKEYEVVQTVIKLREELASDPNALRWTIIAERLRKFYREQEIHGEHVQLTVEMHRRSGTTTAAAVAIEAFIMAERYREALDFISSLEKAGSNSVLQIEKACVYLAAEDKEQARSIARSISAQSMRSPDDLLRLARLQAATQLRATAVKTLVYCFEQTPPMILAKVKKEASEFPEFEPLLTSSEFTAAMTTRSLISADDPACARKWLGVTIDERPWYIRSISRREINFDDWRVAP